MQAVAALFLVPKSIPEGIPECIPQYIPKINHRQGKQDWKVKLQQVKKLNETCTTLF